MQNWNYQECVQVKYEGHSQNQALYQLSQQQIICKMSLKSHYILLLFDRNQTIRLSFLIKLHQKNIVIVSQKMILNIIKLGYQKLKNLQQKGWLNGAVQISDMWLNFGPREDIYITLLSIEDPIITDQQIRDLIIKIFKKFFKNQTSYHPAISTLQKQITDQIDVSFLPYSLELLMAVVQQNNLNFVILERTSNQFCLFIQLIPSFQFQFIQSDRNVTQQFYSLLLNELIINQIEFITTFRSNQQTVLSFTELLIKTLKLDEILTYFWDQSADILLEQQFIKLKKLREHCLQSSLFYPLQQNDGIQPIRDHFILSGVLRELRNENISRIQKQTAQRQCCQQYQNQISSRILQQLSANLTLQLKETIVVQTLQLPEMVQLRAQFAGQITQYQLIDLENPQQIINQYINNNNLIFNQALRKVNQQVERQILQQIIRER